MRENLSDDEQEKYNKLASSLMDEAKKIDGFYGEDSSKSGQINITVSYWRDEASITKWREDTRHIAARSIGKEKWYDTVVTRVAKVERDAFFSIK
jgi:heme-degrading monooxygenase HmoA